MGFRIDDAVNEARATELERLVKVAFAGNNAALGRRLGYKDGSFVGQMLRREKAITEVTWGKLCALREVRPHITKNTPAYPILQSEEMAAVAQAVSQAEPIIALQEVTWEGLGLAEFHGPFQMRIPGDELSPSHRRGELGRFTPGAAPKPSRPVLLLDPAGAFHLRLYREGIGGAWEGYSEHPGFKTLEQAHGVEIVAPMTGSDWG